jgi:hypothetical protein
LVHSFLLFTFWTWPYNVITLTHIVIFYWNDVAAFDVNPVFTVVTWHCPVAVEYNNMCKCDNIIWLCPKCKQKETMNQTLHNGQTCQPTPIINDVAAFDVNPVFTVVTWYCPVVAIDSSTTYSTRILYWSRIRMNIIC